MSILILLIVGGATGYGYYWYKTKLNECQNKYNTKFEKKRSLFDSYKRDTDYFDKMGKCILEADNLVDNLLNYFSKFYVERIVTNYEGVHEMYKELLNKLYDDFESAFENNEYEKTLSLICNMQEAKKYINNRACFSETKKNNKGKIREYFVQIQEKLDNDFLSIAREFLQKTTYESVMTSVLNNIEDNEKLHTTFSPYKLKPRDNSEQISYMKYIAEKMSELSKLVDGADDCYMIADNEYGRCDDKFYTLVNSMNTQSAKEDVLEYYEELEKGNFEKIIKIDLKVLASYVWHFAMVKPFSTEVFEKVSKLYNGVIKNVYTAEILLAEIYYIKQMGGDTVIRNKINDLLDEKNGKIREMIKYNVVIDKVGDNKLELINSIKKNTNMSQEAAERIVNGHTSIVQEAVDYNLASSIQYDLNRTGALVSIKYHHNTSSKLLTTIASGLMWIGAYDSEKQVLEYMLSKQLPMSQKQQERLHSLNNGGGDAPKGYSVSSDSNKLYFDISSISWRDEEYKGFFENLAFEEKILTYSVAVRDEDKELMISRRVKLPEQSIVLDKIKKVFEEEYGETVTATISSCCALSGTNQEELSGILVQSSECKQLGILVHMACIGKKFTIKFFTLFMPDKKNLDEQKQQLISLHKKMSPSVAMWENSLKDTILIAFQQLLNELPSANTVVTDTNDIEF